jgi:lipoprotein NlpI
MYVGGRGREAAADARKFLDLVGWRDQSSQFMALIAHLGYRQAGMDLEARAILEEAAKKSDTGAWPYPVIRFMKGELGAEELLQMTDDTGKKTEAHAYAGMDLLLKGKSDEARKNFEWVREYGNKRYLEYPLALAELARLGN